MLGQQVMVYARRMANEGEPASAVAALGREHSRIMQQLREASPAPDDPVERARREVAEKRLSAIQRGKAEAL
jgi:hypothetical protein